MMHLIMRTKEESKSQYDHMSSLQNNRSSCRLYELIESEVIRT
jgi:hypothetical protein